MPERLPDRCRASMWTGATISAYSDELQLAYRRDCSADSGSTITPRRMRYDPTMEYVDLYLPRVKQGVKKRVGHFISVPGIEAQLAANNYISRHSLLYAINSFTDTGLIPTVKLERPVAVQWELPEAMTLALNTPDAKPRRTLLPELFDEVGERQHLCLRQWHQRRQVCIQQSSAVRCDLVSQTFSKTWHMATESWYLLLSATCHRSSAIIAPEQGKNGAYCLAGERRYNRS